MPRPLIRCFADNRGVTAVEYALLAALLGLACVTALALCGASLTALVDGIEVLLNPPETVARVPR